MVKERWNDHLPISSHRARLGCWIDTGSQTSWSSLTCGEHKMSLHITPCSSCIVVWQNKVGTDIPIGNTCKMRSKLNRKGKEPPVKESDRLINPFAAPNSAEDNRECPSFCQSDESNKAFLFLLSWSFFYLAPFRGKVELYIPFLFKTLSFWGSVICQICPRVLITPLCHGHFLLLQDCHHWVHLPLPQSE